MALHSLNFLVHTTTTESWIPPDIQIDENLGTFPSTIPMSETTTESYLEFYE